MQFLFRKINKFLGNHYLIIFITLLGSLLFFYNLGKESFWQDEAYSYFYSYELFSLVKKILDGETNMWLYYFILHYWLKFGDSEFYIRTLSTMFAVVCIPGIYWLGSIFINRKVGLIAATLFITHSFIISYAQEARAYSMFTFFTIFSSIFYLKSKKEGRLDNWILYILFTVSAVYTHIFSFLLIFIQTILSIQIRNKLSFNKQYFFSLLLIIIQALPIIIFILIPSNRNVIDWVTRPTIKNLIDFLYQVSFNNRPIFLLSVGLIIFSLSISRREFALRIKIFNKYIYFLAWFFFPIIFIFIFSLIFSPLFVPRYLIFVIPPFILLISYAIYKIPKKVFKYSILAIILIFNILQLKHYYSHSRRDMWRSLVESLKIKVKSGDTLFINPNFTEVTFRYYTRNTDIFKQKNIKVVILDDPVTIEPNKVFTVKNLQLIDATAKTSKRIWLITSFDEIVKERIKQRIELQKVFARYFNNHQSYKMNQTIKIFIYE